MNGGGWSTLLLALVSACQAPAAETRADPPQQPANEARPLFPNSLSIRETSPPQTLRQGSLSLTLRSYRFEPAKPDTGARNAFRCGVLIDEGNGQSQALTTIGAPGWTETLSCDTLIESGLTSGTGAQQHLVLIYGTRSPNAEGRTAVVLTRVGSGWAVNEEVMQRLSENGRSASLEKVRVTLKQ